MMIPDEHVVFDCGRTLAPPAEARGEPESHEPQACGSAPPCLHPGGLRAGNERGITENGDSRTLLGTWELDDQLTTLRPSEGFSRIFGWSAPQPAIPFGTFIDTVLDADRERIERVIENCLHTREPFDAEHRILRRDGAVRVLRCRG